MKLRKLLLAGISSCLISGAIFADPVSDINTCLNNFSTQLNYVVPNAVTEHNVYSDAWIGKFVPSLPMHFAIGIEGGVTKLDVSDLAKAAEMVTITGFPSSLVFPTIGLNAKLGGIFLPFDIGLSFFSMNTKDLSFLQNQIDLSFFTLGGNIRWAILQGKGFCPKWSIGAGYYYSKGSVGKASNDYSISTSYITHILVAETQISKTIIFVTPYVGFRAIFTKAETNWAWSASASSAGIGGTFSGAGKVTSEFMDSFIPQLYGGIGLKLALIQLDINGSWDFKNSVWSFGTSLRFKL
ncbi:hypothetical protein [Treponema sp.]|uniref:hypothetical protein n=1 Tax=Treponema sp. TaxID=166 RepID=UPI00298E8630|nr:hypothetical protein [Treponema sp.]MCR5612447.1 hypothetical protein [Treponema sp.]